MDAHPAPRCAEMQTTASVSGEPLLPGAHPPRKVGRKCWRNRVVVRAETWRRLPRTDGGGSHAIVFACCSRARRDGMPSTERVDGAPSPRAPANAMGASTVPSGRIRAASEWAPLHARNERRARAFAGGCFWGVEDTFRQVTGVIATAVGYTGGSATSPTTNKVCSHTTGTAETVLVEFDPTRVPYQALLDVSSRTTIRRHGTAGSGRGVSTERGLPRFRPRRPRRHKRRLAREGEASRQTRVTQVRRSAHSTKAEEYHSSTTRRPERIRPALFSRRAT